MELYQLLSYIFFFSDYQDITGSELEGVAHTLHKLRLTEKGTYIEYGRIE